MAGQSLTFIHLSDIHFTKFSGDNHDLDNDLRIEILRDIKDDAKDAIGTPAGILVCGDIAFSGDSTEYEIASKFLRKMCGILEIPETSVFCVPGNHDVDQDIPKKSEGFVDMQSAIEKAPDLDVKLAAYFHDSVYRSSLFCHIHEYNKFAGKFSCNIDADHPNWVEDFSLNDNSTLRLLGLSSIVVSSHLDNDERKMVLGQYQIPSREPSVTYLSLCHHPTDYWKDSDTMKNRLKRRVSVQLYGHKHLQKVTKIDESLVVGSGAAHPCRQEKEWRPRYNWLSIYVEGTDASRELKISIHPRVLDDDNHRFIPDTNNCDRNTFKEYSLKLDRWQGDGKMQPHRKTKKSEAVIKTTTEKESLSVIRNPKRTLFYRFFELSFVARSRILSELNLINEEDEGMEHIELIENIWQKANEHGCLSEMWEKINSAHSDGAYKENPFEK